MKKQFLTFFAIVGGLGIGDEKKIGATAIKYSPRDLFAISEQIDYHISILKELHELYPPNSVESNSYSAVSQVAIRPQFDHGLIVWCAKKVGALSSLDPLFKTWEKFKDYQGMDPDDDELFMKECCHLIFIIYNNILCSIDEECVYFYEPLRVQWEEIRDLYIQVASLPLANMVKLLDKIVVGLTDAINKHAQHNGGETIFGWLKHNWWIAPTVLAGFITALLIG